MGIKTYLTEQLKKHPSMQPQDVVKLCYQAAHGAEHLLTDIEKARNYLMKEYSETTPKSGDLYEQISDNVCRVNLSAWKAKDLPIEWLFSMFEASFKVEGDAKEKFAEYLKTAEQMLASVNTEFTVEEWEIYLNEYKKIGMPPVHHSERYRNNERPAYRIVDSRFCKELSLL